MKKFIIIATTAAMLSSCVVYTQNINPLKQCQTVCTEKR